MSQSRYQSIQHHFNMRYYFVGFTNKFRTDLQDAITRRSFSFVPFLSSSIAFKLYISRTVDHSYHDFMHTKINPGFLSYSYQDN